MTDRDSTSEGNKNFPDLKAIQSRLQRLTKEEFQNPSVDQSELFNKLQSSEPETPHNSLQEDRVNLAAFEDELGQKQKDEKPSSPAAPEENTTPYELCLRKLLEEMKWPGEERHIKQAMPHFRELDDILSCRGVLHHLGFETWTTKINRRLLPNRLPCLLIDDEKKPKVALRLTENGELVIYDGQTGKTTQSADTGSLTICVVKKAEREQNKKRNQKQSWFFDGFRKFSSKIWLIFGLTFVANLLALATPIFTMNVYNRVIGSKSLDTLVFFVLAILTTLGFELYLRKVRGRLVAYIGSRFNTQLLIEGFKRILGLPIGMTESASVSQQIVRLRQFENVQVFFTGPLVSAVLDLPFTIVFVIAISLIHPYLAIIPLALAFTFVLIGLVSMPITKRNVAITGKARQHQQNLLIETVTKRESIRELCGEDVWIKRWNDVGNEFTGLRFNAQFFDTIMHTLAQSLVMIAGILTLWVGALLVIDAALTVGALIAVMMFVWRILAPIQTAFLSLNRVGQFFETAKQSDLLMSLPLERQNSEAPTLRRSYRGNIVFQNVSFRYSATSEPVFRGLNLAIEEGQMVTIAGEPASGKSSLLKMVLGLYRPQAGSVYLDGLNLQQLDLDEVRTSVGYVSERQEFFYGTLAQNIRLSAPSATDTEIEEALSDAGVWLPVHQLEDGIETRLTGFKLSTLPNSMKQSISLARAFVKNTSIYLLDTPTNFMSRFEEEAFADKLEKLRGTATVIMITNNEQHIRKCDRVIYLRNGVVAFDNTPEAYFEAKQKSQQKAVNT